MTALDCLTAGEFSRAIKAYEADLRQSPDNRAAMSGLAAAYCGLADFSRALPLLLKEHNHEKSQTPDSPGRILDIAIAHWCLDDRSHAINLVGSLCDNLLAGRVNMAPDSAAGATFGLVLLYMAVTEGDAGRLQQSFNFLHDRNGLYDKWPKRYDYPVHSVKQILGEFNFEDALEGATGSRSLSEALREAQHNLMAKGRLGTALYCDGVLKRLSKDQAGCRERMESVFQLGHRTNRFYWYLARHEQTAVPFLIR